MIYYHGTSEYNRQDIENGWLGTVDTPDNLHLSSGEVSKNGYVFLTTDRELAAEYGDLVFVVETELAEYWRDCPVTGIPEYRVRADELNEEGAWWVEGEY